MHTFVDPLYRARALFADAVSMVGGEVRLTYAETWSRCGYLAGALTRLGVEPGDRVAILAANSRSGARLGGEDPERVAGGPRDVGIRVGGETV